MHVTSHSHHKWSVGFCQSFWKIFVYDDLFGNGNLGWNPNFRCASSLLRGSSRICGPDCEPQRAFRGQPPQAALRPRSRHPPRRPLGLPCGRGVKGSIRLAPDQTDRRLRLPRVFSGLWPEARHPPRRPCGLPHGLGVSDPSPCAPPRQAGRPGPIGHCVVGFCGSIRLAPDQTDRRRAPSSGLLGPAARSAASAATTLRAASRARGQRPLPVCPSPASWQARPDRAQCSGVLRHSPGRVGGACLDKK